MTRNFGGGGGLCRRFCGLKLWITQRFNIWQMNRKSGPLKEFMTTKNQNFPNDSTEECVRGSLCIESLCFAVMITTKRVRTCVCQFVVKKCFLSVDSDQETKRTSEPEESSCMSSNLIPSQM